MFLFLGRTDEIFDLPSSDEVREEAETWDKHKAVTTQTDASQIKIIQILHHDPIYILVLSLL